MGGRQAVFEGPWASGARKKETGAGKMVMAEPVVEEAPNALCFLVLLGPCHEY